MNFFSVVAKIKNVNGPWLVNYRFCGDFPELAADGLRLNFMQTIDVFFYQDFAVIVHFQLGQCLFLLLKRFDAELPLQPRFCPIFSIGLQNKRLL